MVWSWGMPTVLIVDDHDGARTTLSGLLRLEGFETATADTGKAGIEMALAQGADVILIDLHLPDMSGIDVVRALKGHAIRAPMVIVTVFPDLDTSFDVVATGAAGYVEGLLFADELIDVVLQALSGRLPVRHPAFGTAPVHDQAQPRPPSPALALRPLPRDRRVQRVVRAIEDEAETAWSIPALAKQVRISESRLRHLFAATVGLALSRFIRERRLQKAARLLMTTSESFQAIADRLHLPRDLRIVRSAFRARFGMSARTYRSRFRRFF
jgi:DNA-binding NarL/FixJ family response regulator